MSKHGPEYSTQSATFGAVCSANVCSCNGTCLIPPCQALGAVGHFLREKLTTGGVSEVNEVLAGSDEGRDVINKEAWKFYKGGFPVLLHLIFNYPSNVGQGRGGGIRRGRLKKRVA